jgi:predicted CoA-binding protein
VSTPKKTVVILGASDKPDRASNVLLTRLLRRGGYDPVPVHPALASIAGVPVRSDLGKVSPRPDVLSVYLGAERSTALEADIVRLKPGRVVFNPGAENPALEAGLNRAGIGTENACSLVLLGQDLL